MPPPRRSSIWSFPSLDPLLPDHMFWVWLLVTGTGARLRSASLCPLFHCHDSAMTVEGVTTSQPHRTLTRRAVAQMLVLRLVLPLLASTRSDDSAPWNSRDNKGKRQ